MKFVLKNRPWLPKVPMQYKKDTSVRISCNQLVMFPLKRVLIVDHDEDNHILFSYKKLFKVFFYYGRRRLNGHVCPNEEVDNGCFMIDTVSGDECLIFAEDTVVDDDVKYKLHKDVMLCFSSAANVDEENTENDGLG
ncbi:hypothetical protein C1H46_002128 [Malus baccata]|uniref:Uncharacterized protein n=1 Tax=Malus baccata TaxID=106549 RepID=A0A540NNL3_MALBA|nr:hypothetical protein C1H46_002128 [Malus baccata]